GSPVYAIGTDIDGESWATTPSIGCDEFRAGAVTGPLTAKFTVDSRNVIAGFPLDLVALGEGRTVASVWDFGDGTITIDQAYARHAWMAAGDYDVVLWVFNDSNPAGVSSPRLRIHVVSPPAYYYVDGTGANPSPPYASWVTAATNIQDAVDAAALGGTVLVTN